MSKAIQNTSVIHQLAYTLGARVQVLDNRTQAWRCISEFAGLALSTGYRVHPDDENIFKEAKKVFKKTHTEVLFRDYKYQVPNNAMNGKSLVLFCYGFGVYATVSVSGWATPIAVLCILQEYWVVP